MIEMTALKLFLNLGWLTWADTVGVLRLGVVVIAIPGNYKHLQARWVLVQY